jgi:hypothetical protein
VSPLQPPPHSRTDGPTAANGVRSAAGAAVESPTAERRSAFEKQPQRRRMLHARAHACTVTHAHTARSMQRCAAACQTETQSVSRMHEWLCCFAAGGGLVCRVQQRTARFYMYDIGSDFGMAAIEVIHPCAAPVSIVSDSPRPAPPRFPTHQQTRIDALTHTLTPPRPPPPGRLVMDR